MASPVCEKYCICFCHVELEITLAGPFDSLRCADSEFLDHLVHIVTIATNSMSSMQDSPSTPWTVSATHYISRAVSIAMRIGNAGEPCGTPVSTGFLCRTLPSITMSTGRSQRKLSVHHIMSPPIYLAFIAWISLHLAMLETTALMAIRSTTVILSSFHALGPLSTMIAAASTADLIFLLSNWLSLGSALLSTSSDNHYVTGFSQTHPMQLSREIIPYDFSFV